MVTKESLLNETVNSSADAKAEQPSGSARRGGIFTILRDALNFNGEVSTRIESATGRPLFSAVLASERGEALKKEATRLSKRTPEKARYEDAQELTKDDLKNILVVIDAPSEITVKPAGHNRTSIIYGRDLGNGKIEYVERVFETFTKNKPRLSTKTVWVRDAATGAKTSPPRVSTPYRNSKVLFSEGRVNSGTVSTKIEPVIGQPLASAIVEFERREANPNTLKQHINDLAKGQWIPKKSNYTIDSMLSLMEDEDQKAKFAAENPDAKAAIFERLNPEPTVNKNLDPDLQGGIGKPFKTAEEAGEARMRVRMRIADRVKAAE
jgi:hypothetical protein